MLTKYLGLCLLFAGVAFGAELKVATYNVQNYLEENRMADGVYRREYPKPESEKDALRAVIRSMNADVLALQEVGDKRFVQELVRDLKNEGLDYPYVSVTHVGGDVRGLALLSKRPFSEEWGADIRFQYMNAQDRARRGILVVRIGDGPSQITLFVLHLKSKYTDRKDDPNAELFREKEAVAIRDYIMTVFPKPEESRFLILGDFNSGRDERPMRSMLRKGRYEISRWVPAVDSRDEYWTYFYRKELSYCRVDHILASPPLADAVKASGVLDGPTVLKASDHRPVFVILK